MDVTYTQRDSHTPVLKKEIKWILNKRAWHILLLGQTWVSDLLFLSDTECWQVFVVSWVSKRKVEGFGRVFTCGSRGFLGNYNLTKCNNPVSEYWTTTKDGEQQLLFFQHQVMRISVMISWLEMQICRAFLLYQM